MLPNSELMKRVVSINSISISSGIDPLEIIRGLLKLKLIKIEFALKDSIYAEKEYLFGSISLSLSPRIRVNLRY